jgi:hypothetical protein
MNSFSALLIEQHECMVAGGFVRMDSRALNADVQGQVKVRAVMETEGALR